MNEATMDSANPYNTPDSELQQGQSELYTPKIISFTGRIGRMRYLAYNMGLNLIMMVAMIPFMGATMSMATDPGAMSGLASVAIILISIVSIVISVMFTKRRLNDLDRSGWWCLLFIVPIANLLLAIYMLFFPGTDGDNNWGSAPSANSIGVLILGWMVPAFFVLGIIGALAVPQLAGM